MLIEDKQRIANRIGRSPDAADTVSMLWEVGTEFAWATGGEPVARAEPDGLAQVLANLLQNASRYTPRGGRASIDAERARSRVLVSITNTGEGIPADDLPHVFERFYRVEKSRDAARGGAGIGLAIVKQLVEGFGGRVGADSNSHFTRFWFSLPIA